MLHIYWAWLPATMLIGVFVGVTITSLCVIAANRP